MRPGSGPAGSGHGGYGGRAPSDTGPLMPGGGYGPGPGSFGPGAGATDSAPPGGAQGGYGPQHSAYGSQTGYSGSGPPGGYAPQGAYGPPGGGYGPPPSGGAWGHPGGGYGPPGYGPPGYPAGGDSMDGVKARTTTSGHMSEMFFAASMAIVVGSLVGGCALFFELQVVDFLTMSYLLCFGSLLAVLDTPVLKTIKRVADIKLYISKYVQFVTRLTGKGITLVFLGSALFLTMWDNLDGSVMKFMSVVICLFPSLVGLYGVVIGVLKSSKLDKARRQVHMVIDQRYDHFARTYPGPSGGLTMSEFNDLTMENGGFLFDPSDLRLIFNAIVSNPAWRSQGTQSNAFEHLRIPKQDMWEWCRGGFVCL
mmetsp:Transcript_24805/g.70841  ORF Transcript_24805/g.70841 Transcript_24805/m.70841 type:complete len:366 (+) Transcript_24805:120-1217(+)